MAVSSSACRWLGVLSVLSAAALCSCPAAADVRDLGSLAAGGVYSLDFQVASASCKGAQTFNLQASGAACWWPRATPGSTADDYKQDWADELHPSPSGFCKVAELFDAAIRELP